MKAIAEYFRDLASEDRFFGAEPPTPDVQMLHAIAQKSSDKPVDAEVADNGLRLTQGAAAQAATAETPAAAEAATAAPAQPEQAAFVPPQDAAPAVTGDTPDQMHEMVADTDDTADHATDEAGHAATAETVEEAEDADFAAEVMAEDTPDADEVVGTPEAEAETLAEITATADEAEEAHEPAAPKESVIVLAEVEETVTEVTHDMADPIFADYAEETYAEDEYSEDGDDGDENLFADLAAPEGSEAAWATLSDEDLAEHDAEEETLEEAEISAREVPSFAEAVRRPAEEPVEEPAVMLEEDDEDVAALFRIEDTQPEIEPEQAREADQPQPEAESSTTSIASKLQRIRSVVAASVAGFGSGSKAQAEGEAIETDDLTDDPAFETAAGTADTPGLANESFLTVEEIEQTETLEVAFTEAPETEEEFEQSFADELAELEQDEYEETYEEALEVAQDAPLADMAPDAPSDESAHGPARRGVALELSDEDLIAAAAMARPRNAPRPQAFERTLETAVDATPETGAEDAVSDTTAPEADDEALLNDLAAIEQQVSASDAAQAAENAAQAAQARRARAQETLGEDVPGNDDETVERLLSQTNSKLNEDHAQRRQSALAHLKAAVAATIADRVGPKDNDDSVGSDDAVDDYRKDLASIVRSKPVDQAKREEAEDDGQQDVAEEGTADVEPLVLVPQARIEAEEQVRPRRIQRAMRDEVAREQDTGFADYAEEVGAHELNDLLEAAAAYLSTVEGKTHFSRPEVMHMVMRHDRERAFSREAQLRSFGDLLRNGTIEKVDRGQFVISNESRFVANG